MEYKEVAMVLTGGGLLRLQISSAGRHLSVLGCKVSLAFWSPGASSSVKDFFVANPVLLDLAILIRLGL